MKSNQEDINLLNAYLKLRLSAEETTNLKERLALEPDLYADLQDLKVIQESLRISVLKGKFDLLSGLEKETKSMTGSNEGVSDRPDENKKHFNWLVLIALLILGAILFWYYQNQGKSKLSPEYSTIFAERFDSELILHKTMRSAIQSDKINAEQRRAYELYSIQLFDDAIPLLSELWNTQKDTLALFYLGVSNLGVGENEKGLLILNKPELKTYSKQTLLFINH